MDYRPLLLLLLALNARCADEVKIHGTLPPGARLEFVAPGSSQRMVASGDAGGAYSVRLPPDRYDIFLIPASGPQARGSAWLTGKEVELNAAPQDSRASSAVEYDLVAEWRVVDDAGKGAGPARVILEAVPARGAPQRLSAWIPVDEEEKHVEGGLTTDPEGRFVFRVNAARIRPDRTVALVVKVEMEGYPPATVRLTPVLEFSRSGHLFARYPEEGFEIKLNKHP